MKKNAKANWAFTSWQTCESVNYQEKLNKMEEVIRGMVRHITFNGKKLRVVNETRLARHGEREHIAKYERQHLYGLTKNGKKMSYSEGAALDKSKRLKLYFSPLIRAKQTAKELYLGHKRAGGQVSRFYAKTKRGAGKRVRAGEKGELVYRKLKNVFLDGEFLKQEIGLAGGDFNVITMKWIMGRYSSDKAIPAGKVGKEIILKRLLLGRRATKRGRKNWVLMNISHDTQIMAVLTVLLGKNPFFLGYKLPKVNESLVIYHVAGNKSGFGAREIMEYAGERIDVTKRIQRLARDEKKAKAKRAA